MSAYTTARVPHARALGAPSKMAGSYKGLELQMGTTRPGAYDALKLPSRMGEVRTTPGERPKAITPPIEPAVVPHAGELLHRTAPAGVPRGPTVRTPYMPRPGSLAQRVISYLEEHGGRISPLLVSTAMGVEYFNVHNMLRTPVAHGLLTLTREGSRAFYELPKATAPAAADQAKA